jgi:hypothetical protein
VSPVKYELGFYIPEDDILHNLNVWALCSPLSLRADCVAYCDCGNEPPWLGRSSEERQTSERILWPSAARYVRVRSMRRASGRDDKTGRELGNQQETRPAGVAATVRYSSHHLVLACHVTRPARHSTSLPGHVNRPVSVLKFPAFATWLRPYIEALLLVRKDRVSCGSAGIAGTFFAENCARLTGGNVC